MIALRGRGGGEGDHGGEGGRGDGGERGLRSRRGGVCVEAIVGQSRWGIDARERGSEGARERGSEGARERGGVTKWEWKHHVIKLHSIQLYFILYIILIYYTKDRVGNGDRQEDIVHRCSMLQMLRCVTRMYTVIGCCVLLRM
jgi:hypothetical protein